MSTLKVNAISDVAAANGNAITLATDGTCTAKITNRSNRNLLYNSDMRIAQRGTSAVTLNTWGGQFAVDRWRANIRTWEEGQAWEQGSMRRKEHNGNTGAEDASSPKEKKSKMEIFSVGPP